MGQERFCLADKIFRYIWWGGQQPHLCNEEFTSLAAEVASCPWRSECCIAPDEDGMARLASVINASTGSVSICKWNKVRCPSLKPMRTMKASVPLGREPEPGLLSEQRNSLEELSHRGLRADRKRGRALNEWYKLKLCPLLQDALRFLLLKEIYDTEAREGLVNACDCLATPHPTPQATDPFAFYSQEKKLSWPLSADGRIMNRRICCQQKWRSLKSSDTVKW